MTELTRQEALLHLARGGTMYRVGRRLHVEHGGKCYGVSDAAALTFVDSALLVCEAKRATIGARQQYYLTTRGEHWMERLRAELARVCDNAIPAQVTTDLRYTSSGGRVGSKGHSR